VTALLLALFVQEPSARIAELAPELQAKEVARVYRAVERLAELGAAAAPLLEARAKEAPADARPYLLLAAEQARHAATLPDGGRSRRFTIQYAPQNLGLLMQDFQRRTGAKFSLDGFAGEELPDVGVELKEATFGQALEAISRAGKMTPRRESGSCYLQPAPVELPMFSYAGYLLFLDTFTQSKSVDFQTAARNRIALDLQVIWDPTIRLVSAGRAVVTDAADDLGRPLAQAPAQAERKEEGPVADPAEFLAENLSSIELSGPAGVAKIDFVRGYVPIRIEKVSVPLVLASPAAGSSVKTGGFELVLKRMKPEEGTIDLEVTRTGQKADEWKHLPVSVSICDPSGERLPTSVAIVRDPASALKLTVYCDFHGRGPVRPESAKLSKVEVSIATEVTERRIPFEFRGLKLR
jgi:hypothetical protein